MYKLSLPLQYLGDISPGSECCQLQVHPEMLFSSSIIEDLGGNQRHYGGRRDCLKSLLGELFLYYHTQFDLGMN